MLVIIIMLVIIMLFYYNYIIMFKTKLLQMLQNNTNLCQVYNYADLDQV